MLRIKKLDIFIAKQFGLLFVGTFFISIFVLMMQFVWQYVDTLIGKGLTLTILGQFFWYLGLMTVPQALPLAILLSSLITFGNLGEKSELTAIRASGVSLLQSLRLLSAITVVIMCVSFIFQNNIGPMANQKVAQLFISMKQKSPELEIPEGIFYSGIPNSNIYVQRKDMESGKLYGIMIYRMTASYEDQAIILADSGMMQSTAEKKHLVLTLWSGEWFENMQASELGNSASVPYRRETFVEKKIVLDFDADFNITDMASLSNNAKGKSLAQLSRDLDSLRLHYDSIGASYMADAKLSYYRKDRISRADSLKAMKVAASGKVNFDTLYQQLTPERKIQATNGALSKAQTEVSDLEFKKLITQDGDWLIRMHRIEQIRKFTLSLSCLFFFFIGASLGAIIRKGGLGVPIIVSVFVFIVYYIIDNVGYQMSKRDTWDLRFGMTLSTAILTPIAIFITYKANNDSMVFNLDLWRSFFMRLLGLRSKRHIAGKEVIISQPDYREDAMQLAQISKDVLAYAQETRLRSAPNVINVFFRYRPDHEIERINEQLERIIDDLSNTRDRQILAELNNYPILAVKAHTRPFERKWLNVAAAVCLPVGLFLYFRMWIFRLRMLRDLRTIRQTNANIMLRAKALA